MIDGEENLQQLHSDYGEDGFVVVPALVAEGERTLLLHMQPTIVWSGQTVTLDAQPEELPPALVARCRDLTSRLLGTPTQLAFAQWYCKPPESPDSGIDWHQDRAFWPASRPPTVTTWLALDRADGDNGCLEFLPRSHRTEELLPHRLGKGEMLTCRRALTDEALASAELAHTNHCDCVAYHEKVAHRSRPNRSGSWRRAVILGWNETGT